MPERLPSETRSSGRLRSTLGVAGGLLLGGVLLVAALAKALDPAGFAEQITAEGLDLVLSAEALALVALALEVALGAALVLGLRRWWVLVPTTLLVAFFLFLTGRTYWRDAHGVLVDSAACGCFGNLVDRTPAQAFWQDLVLLVPGLVLAFWGRVSDGRFWRGRIAIVALLTLGVVVFAWHAPSLPLDNLATRLQPGVRVQEICAGREGEGRICLDGLVPDLETGRHWVLMTELHDAGFEAVFEPLNRHAIERIEPKLWVLTAATPEELQAFQWRWAPAFDVREAPKAMLRPLYRSLPRSFYLENGRVLATESGEMALVGAPGV